LSKNKKLPLTFKWHWIKGHQDDNINYEQLDSWAKNNVQADTMAKLYWNHCEKTGKRLPNHKLTVLATDVAFQTHLWSLVTAQLDG
jgi:ribonuclease HI